MDGSSVGMAGTKGHQLLFRFSVRSIYVICFGLEPGTQNPLHECIADTWALHIPTQQVWESVGLEI